MKAGGEMKHTQKLIEWLKMGKWERKNEIIVKQTKNDTPIFIHQL